MYSLLNLQVYYSFISEYHTENISKIDFHSFFFGGGGVFRVVWIWTWVHTGSVKYGSMVENHRLIMSENKYFERDAVISQLYSDWKVFVVEELVVLHVHRALVHGPTLYRQEEKHQTETKPGQVQQEHPGLTEQCVVLPYNILIVSSCTTDKHKI